MNVQDKQEIGGVGRAAPCLAVGLGPLMCPKEGGGLTSETGRDKEPRCSRRRALVSRH